MPTFTEESPGIRPGLGPMTLCLKAMSSHFLMPGRIHPEGVCQPKQWVKRFFPCMMRRLELEIK